MAYLPCWKCNELVWSDSDEGYGVHFDCGSSQTARLERVVRRMRTQLRERLETIIANQAVSEDDTQWLKAGLKRANAFYKFANDKKTFVYKDQLASVRHDDNLLDLFSLTGKFTCAIQFTAWDKLEGYSFSQLTPLLKWMIPHLAEYIHVTSDNLQLKDGLRRFEDTIESYEDEEPYI